MGTYNFQDQTPVTGTSPDGDYIVEVVEFEEGISGGAKTAGSTKYTLKLKIETTGTHLTEVLVDHKSTAWKIDQFLRASNFASGLKKGQNVELTEETILGLRAWVTIFTDKTDPKWPRNKVSMWLTDKAPLPRAKQGSEFEDE